MIDKEKFYWACRKYGLYKLADALGLCHSAIGKKMHNPTENLYAMNTSTSVEYCTHTYQPPTQSTSILLNPHHQARRFIYKLPLEHVRVATYVRVT